jgi:hypothetical protein
MPGFEVFGEKEKQEILDVLETGVLFRYEFGEQRKGVWCVPLRRNLPSIMELVTPRQ